MAVITAAKTKLFIGGAGDSSAGPVTEGAYVEVGEISNMGEFGDQFELITFAALSDRNVRKFKGTRNSGSLTLELGQDISDDGQNDLRTALESDLDFNFKIELNDDPGGTGDSPTTYYFQAKVMSFVVNVGEVNSIIGATAVVEIQSGTLSRVNAS
jgi:hypothetical protein